MAGIQKDGQDEKIKKQFINSKKDDIINFDIKKAFTNETDLAAMLNIKKEELADLAPNFQAKITKIEKFVPAEINQELFDKAFGEGKIKSKEEFNNKIKEQLTESYENVSTNRLKSDLKKIIMDSIEMQFPEDFIIRWQLSQNENAKDEKQIKTKEQIEKELPSFKDELKWYSIKGKVMTDNEMKITKEDEINANKILTYSQFMNYGIPAANLTDELITNIATENLEKLNENDKYYIREIAMEEKVFDFLIKNISIETKNITFEEFQNLDKKIDTKELELDKEDTKKEEEKKETEKE